MIRSIAIIMKITIATIVISIRISILIKLTMYNLQDNNNNNNNNNNNKNNMFIIIIIIIYL